MIQGRQECGVASGRGAIGDVSRERDRLRISGGDRVSFLQGQCTNDVARLGAGEDCYAAFLNAKGKMRGETNDGPLGLGAAARLPYAERLTRIRHMSSGTPIADLLRGRAKE
jgi:hypothetical protein